MVAVRLESSGGTDLDCDFISIFRRRKRLFVAVLDMVEKIKRLEAAAYPAVAPACWTEAGKMIAWCNTFLGRIFYASFRQGRASLVMALDMDLWGC